MTEDLYSKRSKAQFRGPTTSDKYNERVDNLFKDLAFLNNRVGVTEEKVVDFLRQSHKSVASMEKAMSILENRVESLENDALFFRIENQDTARFDGTAFEINAADRLNSYNRYGFITLPVIVGSSESRIRYQNSEGEYFLPSNLSITASGVTGSADSSGATINQSNLYNACLGKAGRVWERNVIVDSVNPEGAIVSVYVGLPVEVASSLRANYLVLNPFPSMGLDIMEIAYSTKADINLNDSDEYTPLNDRALYASDSRSIGISPPGAWTDDETIDAGPRSYHFDPKNITALKITLRTRNYYTENSKIVYTYGLADLDLRSEKHLDEGKGIFKLEAPVGQTISSIDSVAANIYNVSPIEAQEIFSYRVIWETAFDSGTYTLDPVPFSDRVWVEVTLKKTINGGTPALSSIDVEYS